MVIKKIEIELEGNVWHVTVNGKHQPMFCDTDLGLCIKRISSHISGVVLEVHEYLSTKLMESLTKNIKVNSFNKIKNLTPDCKNTINFFQPRKKR